MFMLKTLIVTLVFKKFPIFFAENWRKRIHNIGPGWRVSASEAVPLGLTSPPSSSQPVNPTGIEDEKAELEAYPDLVSSPVWTDLQISSNSFFFNCVNLWKQMSKSTSIRTIFVNFLKYIDFT
jgi:hypothetical protein